MTILGNETILGIFTVSFSELLQHGKEPPHALTTDIL